MVNFDQIKKGQKFSFQQNDDSARHKLVFKRMVKFGDIKTLLCKITGNVDWYGEVYLTISDFEEGRARVK